jgi:hypothetical protein
MFFYISLEYNTRDILSKLSPEDYARARTALIAYLLPENQAELPTWYNYGHKELVDEAELKAIVDLGIVCALHKMRGLSYHGALPSAVRDNGDIDHAKSVTLNVSVAGKPLHAVNEVTWLEDCCTQELQRNLDDGWRILCVCPPHDQRRPTYILGRTKAKEK